MIKGNDFFNMMEGKKTPNKHSQLEECTVLHLKVYILNMNKKWVFVQK